MKQKTILGCAKALMFSAVLGILFCVLMAVFTAQVGSHDTLNVIISAALSQLDKKLEGKISENDKI